MKRRNRVGRPATPRDSQQSASEQSMLRFERSLSDGGPLIHVGSRLPTTTVVFETYWRFAAERQSIFFKRLRRSFPPWTTDPILLEYKFTNVYRASDRVSQFLIRNVIYAGDADPVEVFFRTILFKLFNKIGTWKLLERVLGDITYREYSYSEYDRILTDALERGDRIYSAAYIMPSGTSTFRATRKHRAHLQILDRMIEDEVPLQIQAATRMADAFRILRSYPLIGDFLAYQYVTDLNYSTLTDFSEDEFVIPGPGAVSGIRKCFGSLGNYSETDIIKEMASTQEEHFKHFGVGFQTLGGRPLQFIDCQNLFCEVDKYARIKHPDFVGTGRTRIKQRFRTHPEPVMAWYPPKWGINDKIERLRERTPEE